jgi:cystathionine beta-lyase/cystathionine gamma-synthase
MIKPDTIAVLGVHKEPDSAEAQALTAALNLPIFQTTAFGFRSFAEMQAYAMGQQNRYMYSRYASPNAGAVEERVAALEEAPAAILTSSGMAAIFVSLLAAVAPGEEILALATIYGGTYRLLREVLPQVGRRVRFLTADQLPHLDLQVTPQTRLLWLETPTNPTNQLIDLATVATKAHQLGLQVAVDNTFASPINQQPRRWGVDIVVHSATKYLSGHDDLTAGIIVGEPEFIERARRLHVLIGTTPDPHMAYLLLRGIKTLALRMERINKNGQHLAEWFSKRPEVAQVFYPLLESHPGYQLATRQMLGGSGIVTIELAAPWATTEAVAQLVDNLQLIRLAATLGGTMTKVSYPLYTSHAGLSASELATAGVTNGMLRFAVGVEAITDIVADIEQAFEQLAKISSNCEK